MIYKIYKIFKIYSLYTDKVYYGYTTKDINEKLNECKRRYLNYIKYDKSEYLKYFEVVKYKDCNIIILETCNCELKLIVYKRDCYRNNIKFNLTDFQNKKRLNNYMRKYNKLKIEVANILSNMNNE